jgi:hypothetical protein
MDRDEAIRLLMVGRWAIIAVVFRFDATKSCRDQRSERPMGKN